MDDKIRKTILDFLKKQKDPVNQRDIVKGTGISYPTVMKHCDILKEGGKIEIYILSQMKVIKIKK